MGIRSIGVNTDDGNALFDGSVDRRVEHFRTGRRHQNPRGMFGYGLLEGIQLLLRTVGVRAGEIGLDPHRPSGLLEAHLGLLPVRQRDVGRNKKVALVLLMESLLT